MRHELQLILASAPLHPSEAELQTIDALIPAIEDWNKLALLLIDRGTAPLLYRKLPQLKNAAHIPTQAQELLRKAYYKTVSSTTLIYQEFVGLAQILQSHNIPFIPLKGICMSEWLYGDTGLRQMSDIDILIHEKDGVRCIEAMRTAGYFYEEGYTVGEFVDAKSRAHFNPLYRNNVMIEIHTKLQNFSEKDQQNLDEIWTNSQPIKLNGVSTLRLELTDMLIYYCLHLDKHFFKTHVQFTSFNDIFNLLRMIDSRQQTTDNGENAKNKEQRIKTEEIENFWDRFEAKCIVQGFTDTVFTYLVLVANYYKAPLPQYLVDKYGSLLTEEVKNRFENFLAGTENEFIRRGATRSNIGVHVIHLQRLKNPIDFLRYLKGVVFPGKAFMIDKYSIKQPRLFWLWYLYRYYCGLKGFWYVVRGNTEKRKEK